MDSLMKNSFFKYRQQEKEAIARWFNEFQPIDISIIGNMKIARGIPINMDKDEKYRTKL
ncbi:hypothetical protein CREGCYN_05150 [Synechococcus sp. M16CYN]